MSGKDNRFRFFVSRLGIVLLEMRWAMRSLKIGLIHERRHGRMDQIGIFMRSVTWNGGTRALRALDWGVAPPLYIFYNFLFVV